MKSFAAWLVAAVLAGATALALAADLVAQLHGQPLKWHSPHALWLAFAALPIGVLGFHLRRRRTATLGFSTTAFATPRFGWSAAVLGSLRIIAVLALVVAVAQPESRRIVRHEVDSIDIMIAVDMSQSMEEADLPRNRLDAAQRVIRRFLRRTTHDHIGLVVFGKQAMLQCPLTDDTQVLDQIVRDLVLGDVPSEGTAIGNGLALALSQLKRSQATSKIVILLSDGNNNEDAPFTPEESAQLAKSMGVKVYTLLVGREDGGGPFGYVNSDDYVDPATLRNIAAITGGEFYRATDYDSFDRGFQTVRDKLDKTKRIVEEAVPDQQLFGLFALLAACVLALELALASTWLRRWP